MQGAWSSSASGTRVENAACRRDYAPAVQVFAFATEPPWSIDWSSKLAAAPRWCEASMDARYVVVFCL